MNKFLTKDGSLKYQSVKSLLIATNELWVKVNQIAKECGVPQSDFMITKNDLNKRTIYTPQDIIYKVNKKFGVKVANKDTTKIYMYAKHAARFLLDKYTKLSHEKIASLTGSINHTCVGNSIKRCKDLIDTEDEYLTMLNQLMADVEKEVE